MADLAETRLLLLPVIVFRDSMEIGVKSTVTTATTIRARMAIVSTVTTPSGVTVTPDTPASCATGKLMSATAARAKTRESAKISPMDISAGVRKEHGDLTANTTSMNAIPTPV